MRFVVGVGVLALAACGAKSRSIVGDADLDADTDVDSDVDTDSDTGTDLGSDTAPFLTCSDRDGDGYGVGDGCLGPDCDDSNPEAWDEAQCAAICDGDPRTAGCPCKPEQFPEPEICYSGAPETLGIGPCRAGLRQCLDGRWTPCEGQVVPRIEECNDSDDDCNGVLDEAAACGLEAKNFCITYDGGATAFCGIDCSDGQTCPGTTSCVDVGDGAGGTISRQCIPDHVDADRDGCTDEDRAICPPMCLECDSDDVCAPVPACR